MKPTRFLVTLSLCALPMLCHAQIYRCETPSGPVFSDERCSETAQVVELKDETRGIGGGSTEGVRPGLSDQGSKRENAQKTPDSQAVFMPVRAETTAANNTQRSTQRARQEEPQRSQRP